MSAEMKIFGFCASAVAAMRASNAMRVFFKNRPPLQNTLQDVMRLQLMAEKIAAEGTGERPDLEEDICSRTETGEFFDGDSHDVRQHVRDFVRHNHFHGAGAALTQETIPL